MGCGVDLWLLGSLGSVHRERLWWWPRQAKSRNDHEKDVIRGSLHSRHNNHMP